MFAFFRSIVLLAAIVFIAVTAARADAPTVTDVHPLGSLSAARTYDVLEWSVTLDQTPVNPFDFDDTFDDTTVEAVFTRVDPKHSQSVKSASLRAGVETLVVPGFWYEPFLRENKADKSVRMGKPSGAGAENPGWRIRFCPPAPSGTWMLRVWAKNKERANLSRQTFKFSVGDSGKPVNQAVPRIQQHLSSPVQQRPECATSAGQAHYHD